MEKLNITEVVLATGISYNTLNNWYRFKKKYPENEYSKMLPEFRQETTKATRYWDKSDIWRLLEFKSKLPHGRGGVMGMVTQKYVKKPKEGGNEENSKRDATATNG